jgi:hypothetical protein
MEGTHAHSALVAHWAKARFDNLKLAEHVAGPPSEL